MGYIVKEAETYLRRFPRERELLIPFLPGFTVTWVRQRRAFGIKLFVYFLKPDPLMEEAFGFEREILLAYSPESRLQPNVVKAIGAVMRGQPAEGRVDTMIAFLISEDPNPEDWASQYLMQNPESRLLAGFHAADLRNAKGDSWYVRRALAAQLYQRDLFDYRLPLRSDAYFFGREDLLFDFFNAIKRSENRGLFGLRKTGKTSVLYQLRQMVAPTPSLHFLYYDCKYPGLRSSTWEELLNRISSDIQQIIRIPKLPSSLSAPDRFLATVSALPSQESVALVFDEIEYISPFAKLDKEWASGFVPFWQTMWACQSQHPRFSIIIAGVNPTVVEQDLIDHVQNPLFGIVPTQFLRGLRPEELQRMVRSLGKRMGLRFSASAIGYLHERYGGHPLLTRIACSLTHRTVDDLQHQRPYEIHDGFLQAHESSRDSELSFYCRHVVSELHDFYKDEYDLLEGLASGQTAEFMEFTVEPEFTSHLTNYGLLGRDKLGRPTISIPVVARYLGLEMARREGRRTILRVVPAQERARWIKRRVEAIDSDFDVLQRLTRDAQAPTLFGPNSYPESHKFHTIPVCATETEFASFINTCNRCFVESVEAVGGNLGKKDYFRKDIALAYPALHEALYRIKLYRHHRVHLKLFPSVEGEVRQFLERDLEGRNPSQVEDLWFVLQQCVLDSLLTSIITEVDRLS